jgi:plasmid stabilization system protein ParE
MIGSVTRHDALSMPGQSKSSIAARAARLWYAERSSAAALRFMRELDHAIAQITESPHRWPEHLHGTRRYRLDRFPYLIVYREQNDRVQVIACQHGHRRPGYWRDRLHP